MDKRKARQGTIGVIAIRPAKGGLAPAEKQSFLQYPFLNKTRKKIASSFRSSQ